MVNKSKTDDHRNIRRNKVRLVSQGYTQVKGIDFDEIIALVYISYTDLSLLDYCCLNHVPSSMCCSRWTSRVLSKMKYYKKKLMLSSQKNLCPKYLDYIFKLKKVLYRLKQALENDMSV